MKAEKRIKKFIGIRWADVTGVVLLMLVLLSGLVGILLDCGVIGKNLNTPTEMTNETESGYVYLDIYAISKQVYYWHEDTAKDYYYLANDEDGNFYFVMFNEPMDGILKQQRAYWDDYTEEKKPEEPYRVCGTVRRAANDAFDALKEDTGFEAEKLERLISNGGKTGIDVGLYRTRHIASLFEMSAICFGVFTFIWICFGSRRRKLTRHNVKRLRELGLLEKAAQELEAAGKNKTPVLLTKSFVFVHRTGAVFAYDDIVLLFNSATSVVFFTKTISFCSLLNTMNMRPLLEELVHEIAKRSPYARVGATEENLALYAREYPDAKRL